MIPDAWLPLAFMGLMALAIMIYAVLDGYDLGVGILLHWGSEADKDRMIASIGPFWDANETWLVLGVGLLLTAFPRAHGVVLSTLYLPVTLMLICLVLRGVAFDFRAKARSRHKALWNRCFWFGSLGAAATQGYMLGLYVLGFQGGAGAVTFALLSALCVSAGYTLIGACWLIGKTEGELQMRAIRWARRALVLTAIGITCVSLLNPLVSPRIFERWFSMPEMLLMAPVPLAALGLMLFTWKILGDLPRPGDRDCWQPFVAVAGVFVASFIGLAYSFYPDVIPGQLAYQDAAASPASLRFVLVGAMIVMPAILVYTVFAYRVFRGKATALRYD